MLYLLKELIVPLTLAAVFGGGLAGWSWHCLRNRALWAERDGERNRLRNELLGLVGYQPANDTYMPGSDEVAALRRELDAANDDVAALRKLLKEREEACTEHDRRIAELEIALKAASSDTGAGERLAVLEAELNVARTKAGELERRAAQLTVDLDAATAPQAEPVEVSAMRWKSRYLESRVGFLEAKDQLAAAAPVAEDRSAELEAAHARILDLEEELATRPSGSDDDLNRERWKTRYLDARVRYLEGEARIAKPAPLAPQPPVDAEAENRKRWRQRYLEARVAWLEGRLRDAGSREEGQPVLDTAALDAANADLASLRERLAAAESRATQAVGERARIAGSLAEKEGALAGARVEAADANRRRADLEAERTRLLARIADLENAPPQAPAEDPDAAREKWRTRYLDSRVRFLEQSIALAPRAAEPRQPPPRDDTFAPLEAGAEIRPAGLPAARGGAPDDLRMIAGVGPRIESTLNSLGVYHFDQIAAWTPANVEWIERYLAFKGRIGREKWIEQSKALARGEETEGRRRYLEGEHV
jgi:predicted flap endonuclease-1-like 5' DNA nuclease